MQFNFYTPGQRVKFIYKHSLKIEYGEEGTIVPNPWDTGDLAVDWDKEETGRHDCGGATRKGHGWWVEKNHVEVIH